MTKTGTGYSNTRKEQLTSITNKSKKSRKDTKEIKIIEPTNEGLELRKFLARQSNGYTEFRIVVKEDKTAYAHVLGRDSETIDFSLKEDKS
jgi:hypothetical protein